ncbi:hypothetical protein BLNAU_25243 [Blattamonas nauphoetae]|uniref:Uncharacterized protein n=1 Tax=Blattamonas nauphoetae TaxID=2049346 RepID=A0ABQ9WK52_9EUKA|nr:hypothetical protein BLNAU_25243 [Blattamonas nauphoetae]
MDEFREMADEDKQQYVGEFIYTKVEEVDAERADRSQGCFELGLQEGFALLQDDAGLAEKIRRLRMLSAVPPEVRRFQLVEGFALLQDDAALAQKIREAQVISQKATMRNKEERTEEKEDNAYDDEFEEGMSEDDAEAQEDAGEVEEQDGGEEEGDERDEEKDGLTLNVKTKNWETNKWKAKERV